MQAQRPKILVTGANGFIGQSLVEELIRRRFPVVAVARKARTFPPGAEVRKIGDINAKTEWQNALENVDVVIHLAARVHVMHDKDINPLEAFRQVNLHGTVNLAKQASAAGVKRFVYVSSVKVNGEQTQDKPFTESCEPRPQDAYAISKWEAEQALREIADKTGLEVVVIRPPLVYGPGVKSNFYRLLKLVSYGWPLPFGAINNRRSIIYVKNLVDILILCTIHARAAGQTYLVSDGQAISTPQLAREIAGAMGIADRIFSVPLLPMRWAASLVGRLTAFDRLTQSLETDSSKIRNELGWQPPYTTAQGIQAGANWYHQSVKVGRG